MNIRDVENLSAADLKARRAECVEAGAAEQPGDLAERFVDARIDAKLRDEKLAEQGVTITNLNEALRIKTERIAEIEQTLAAIEARLKEREAVIENITASHNERVKERDDANARADRLKAEAQRHAAALSAAQKALADASAADQIDAADRGD